MDVGVIGALLSGIGGGGPVELGCLTAGGGEVTLLEMLKGVGGEFREIFLSGSGGTFEAEPGPIEVDARVTG